MKKIFGMPLALAIIGLLVIGGATAALLQVYVFAAGTADVQQSVTWSDETTEQTFSFDEVDSGSETLDVFTLQNNVGVEAEYEFETKCDDRDYISGNARSTKGTDINWGGQCEGIATRYVEYFDDAGHNFGNYEVPVCDENISNLNDITSDNTVYCVETGSYNGDVTIDNSGVKVYSVDGQGEATIEGTVTITANDVVFSGFNVEVDGDKSGVKVTNNDVEVSYNRIVNTDYEGDNSYEVWGLGGAISEHGGSGRKYHNNYMEGFKWGIYANSQLEKFEHNTIVGVRNGIVHAGGDTLAIDNNVFKYVHRGISHTDGSPVTAEGNNFFLGNYWEEQGSRHISENAANPDVEANNNYFGNPTQIQVRDQANIGDGVKVSFKTKTDTTLDAGETDKFGVINTFAINLAPGDYTLKSNILPVVEE